MVKCKNCGEEIDNKNFCPKCGTKNEIMICPSCESELDDDDIFCPECGEKIKDEPSEEKTEDAPDEKEEAPDEKEDKTGKTEDKKESKELKTCPHCNTKIEDEDAEYCLECGKPINADLQSTGIKETIQAKKLIIFSIISIIFSIFLSLIFSFIFGMIGQTTDLYPIGFFISLLIIIAIFGSFKDLLNGGLLGIITGLVTGLLCNGIVELSGGFAFSYQMFSGYAPIIFTIFGAIVGVISTKYLRKSVTKYIDVEKLF
ncbi:MAG: zinc-ribbon domain-containing protein [Methanobrevibacter thaueri]|jgi:rRNA maturation endonuclease Nob1|uniref:Zinc-ribbon domain-containing protein n=1 Tax=Methanobrevibacter thaueri TaxID=190975 RepID=A0A8T3V6F2_9EURY|nr:zinc-ribbon domain-containing protein [Methanobrevibacter thaueri]MBE6502173.1 zinc-ribbon domain-containing protein [Methanobrevibacter thaueri]